MVQIDDQHIVYDISQEPGSQRSSSIEGICMVYRVGTRQASYTGSCSGAVSSLPVTVGRRLSSRSTRSCISASQQTSSMVPMYIELILSKNVAVFSKPLRNSLSVACSLSYSFQSLGFFTLEGMTCRKRICLCAIGFLWIFYPCSEFETLHLVQ